MIRTGRREALVTPAFVSNSLSEPQFPEESYNDARTLVEEIACAIADAQAALFAGRFHDLERCTLRQQELCAILTTYARGDTTPAPLSSSPD
jgi:hypothetical protein